MRNSSIALCLICLNSLTLIGCNSLPDDPPEVVESVDLARYAGLWYEIARLPVFFQNEEDRATAEYTLNSDGTIHVVNTAIKPDGTSRSVTGTAVPVAATGNAKLRVTINNFFARLFGSPPSYGNYWILRLADDYSIALVGSPDRETLWLLNREPSLPEETINRYLKTAQEEGYNIASILIHRDQ